MAVSHLEAEDLIRAQSMGLDVPAVPSWCWRLGRFLES